MKEPKLRFYLDNKPDKDGKHQIFIDISIGYSEVDPTKEVKNFRSDEKRYKPIKISALRRIKPEYFGRYVQKGKRTVFVFDENVFNKYSRNDRSIRTRLEQIKSAVNFVVNNFYHLEVSPTNKEFKEALEMKLGRKRKEIIKEKTVLDFLYEKIKNDRRDRELNKKDALSENHIKTYVSLSRMFENYHLATNTQVLFSDFNSKEFYWNFFKVVDAIYRGEIEVDNPNQSKKQRKNPKGYGVKSINKYIKLLHRILSLGRKAGENVTLDTSDSSLFLKNPPAEKEIYLDEREIKLAIENTVNQSEMSNAREYLIIASLMGLRIEDMENLHELSPELFKGKKGNFYGVRTMIGKTKTETVIPLLKPVRNILKANNDRFPEFKERSVNVNLKKFAKLAGINSLEKRTKISFNQGNIITEGIPKYSLLSTHDCRRSFITNLLSNGVSGERIKYITHPRKVDTKDMIALYNKADLLDKAEAFLEEIQNCDSEIYKYSI